MIAKESNPNYTLSGRITNLQDEPLEGLVVRAYDQDPYSADDPLGLAVTDGVGQYTIRFTQEQFKPGGKESGGPDVFIRVFDGDTLLRESSVKRNAKKRITINLAVDHEPYVQPEEGDDDTFVVKGMVRSPDGKPGINVLVKAFDVRLRREYSLGQDAASKDGHYEISYTRKQFRHAGKIAADLRVRAYEGKNQEIAHSDIIFDAGEDEEIDLTIGNTAYRGPSEYEQLVTLLEPGLRGLNLAELEENDEYQDVAYLSGNTGVDPRLVALLVAANRLSARTAIPAEIFYGLFRNDLPLDLPSLMIQDPAALRRVLELAVADNIIPDHFADEIDKLPGRFKELVVEEAVRPTAAGEISSPLAALLSTTLTEPKEQKEFLQRYVAHTGPIETFWDDLSASPEFADKVDGLQFTLQAGAFTGNHLPLVHELQRMHSDPKEKISSTRDLVRFDEAGWRRILERSNGQGIIGAPPSVPGEDETEKLENYARSLDRSVERSEPTAYLAARLEENDPDQNKHLLTFLRDNESDFDITGARLETYLHETPEALEGIAEKDRPALKQQIRAMQRVYRVAPKYTAMSALLKGGIGSALDITRIGSTLFALKYGEALEASRDSTSAQRVYERAESIHATAVALLSTFGPDNSRVSMQVLQDKQPQDIESFIPDWATLFGSLEMCACDHCRSVYSPAAYLVDLLHFLQDRLLVDPESIIRDDFGHITSVTFQPDADDPSRDRTAKDELFERRGDLGEIELTCENTNTLMPYVDLVNEVLEDYVAPPPPFPPFSPFNLDPARVSDLDEHTVSSQLRAAFTAPPLSEHATIEVQKAGKRWRIHDLPFTYTLRKEKNEPLQVTTRSRQTSGSPQELAANPQYLNPDAYDKLKERVFPLTLPFDLSQSQARPYLDHLGVQRSQIMETFLPGDRAARLANHSVGREWLNLTTAEADLIMGKTTRQSGASDPGVWNLWGFAEATLDDSVILNPHPHLADDIPENLTAWLDNGAWLSVLTDRVDVFLQQSGLKYKEMLALLGAYFINPDSSDDPRPITIEAHKGQPEDTCETQHLRIVGMDQEAALRSLRFIRLWRKLDWTMRDLDRALSVLGVNSGDPISDAVLTQLSHIQRLSSVLRQPVQQQLPFWGEIDTARYIDHDASGQPNHTTLYERLFRNKSVLNPHVLNKSFPDPPKPAFTEDPADLTGLLSDHAATIGSTLGISVSDLTLLRGDVNVIPPADAQPDKPDGKLSLENLSRLYRHANLAKALRMPIRDYLTALKLHTDPFADPAATILFTETINAVRAAGFTLSELDYLSRHMIVEAERVAPTDEEVARVLAELRAELQRIAVENTFVDDPDAPGGPTVDLEGDLTREKLALLGWNSDLIDEVIATLSGSVTYRTALAALPGGVSLPMDTPQITYDDAEAGQLQFTGVMTVAQRGALVGLSAEAGYQAAIANLFDAPRRFVQRSMRSYSIEHFKAPLATLPNITFPVMLENHIYHDVESGQLYFVGAMSEDERDQLLELSPDADFQTAITVLFAAPDTPSSVAVFLTHQGAGSDTATLFNADNPDNFAPVKRFDHVLRKLMPHLRNLFSERTVSQKLADTFGLEIQTTHDLLTQWLDWTGHAGEKLLAAFLDRNFVRSNTNIPVTRVAFADQFDAYLRLQKIALIVERFECTPRQVGWLFTYAAGAGWPDLATLPLTAQETPVASLETWLRLIELFALRDRLPRAEEMLDDFLRRVAAVDNGANDTDKDAAKETLLAALVQWTEWPKDDLITLLGAVDDHQETGLLDALFPNDYAGVRLLARLDACFGLLNRLGMSAAQCRDLVTADVNQSTAEMIKQAVRAKYDEAQWLELAQSLRDPLREQQRVALVAYLLAHPDAQHTWRNANDIYSYFLIDVEMDPCMMTSRIKQAISSVQLFVQRCLMNLEPQVLASAEVDNKWRQWEWMKNYRVWEANRKIFLNPENWIEPELRDDKTPFFLDLESELLQNNLTYDTAETAFRSYLEKLDAVARLEIVGMYHDQDVNVLHVFGRTAGIPHIYYYRRRANDETWTAWERVDLDIEGDHLIPIVWRGRLYLIWPIFTDRRQEPTSPFWEIHLARSEYRMGNWSPKRISEVYTMSYMDKDKLAFKGSSSIDYVDVEYFRNDSRAKSDNPDIPTVMESRILPTTDNLGARVIDNGDGDDDGDDGDNDWTKSIIFGGYVRLILDYGKFRLADCNGDFVVSYESYRSLPSSPTNLQGDYNWLRGKDSTTDQLYLPKTASASQSGVALQKTPDSPFRILYSHQDDGFSGLRTRPWFFNDDTHAYFVTVHQPLLKEVIDPGRLKAVLFAPAPDDPFDPSIRDRAMAPAINPGDPLLFAETNPVTITTPSPSGNLLAAETRLASSAVRNEVFSPLLVAREYLENVNMNAVKTIKSLDNYRYTFHTFYHPYLCKLIEALNRGGIDGLLQRPQQLRSDKDVTVFEETYTPNPGQDRLVDTNYPVEEIDFNQSGPYSQYNWELFFHAPLLIANSLRQNQRFADAQRWFHTIFDPTDTSGLAVPDCYWQTKPFYKKAGTEYQQQIGFLLRLLASGGDLDKLPEAKDLSDDAKSELLENYDDLVKAVKAGRGNLFEPHSLARTRTTAYQKTVVMKYIDNLIAWGDQLFRRDTLESINEATQLYIMAADILGKRPEEIPPRAVPEVHTYDTIEPHLGDLFNALVQIEEFVPPAFAAEVTDSTAPPPSLLMLYFCVPKNDELLAYWDTVADRLFKIRHCMNIEGVVRQLSLFAPAIDPALLVRAAAAGIDIGSVLNEISAPLPHYRFNVLAQKATELCGELKSLSGALLAALEKRDAEKLALLRTEHETTLLKLIELVREQQLDEAGQQLTVLRSSRDIAVSRYMHYQKLLGAQDTQVPPEGEAITGHEASANVDIKEEDGGVKMIKREKRELAELEDALFWQRLAAFSEMASGVAHAVPNVTFEGFWGGIEIGGSHVGSALSAVASSFRYGANENNYNANRASRMAQHIMREHDWVLQSNSAAKEIMSIDQQIIGADLRKAIADQELKNHRKQIEQAQKVEETMRDKYTNQELYTWMIGQISTVYFQSYQLAYDVAKRAERAFRHELGLQDASYVQFGYWDSLKKGLLAGDRLHHDIKRMEVAYLNQNKREFEITKHVSLAQLDPAALIQLRETGECLMTIPEVLFDLDYPGHYMRRIKNVSITIPAVTGPYTGVPCTLSLIRSSVRRTNTLLSDEYARVTLNDDPRFSDSVGAIQSIVTSGAQNDSGLFETNLRDERFLPFEGAGAISTWRIELPDEFRQFDYDTISDVVLHMRYTARPAGGLLKQHAISETEAAVNAIVKAGQEQGLARLFSIRHEFGSEWHRFLHPASTTDDQTLTLPLNNERFPFLFQGKSIAIEKFQLFVKVRPDFAATHNESTLKFTLEAGDSAPDASNAQPNDILSLVPWNGLLRGEKSVAGQPGNWTITAWLNNAGDPLNGDALEDVVIVCHYTIA